MTAETKRLEIKVAGAVIDNIETTRDGNSIEVTKGKTFSKGKYFMKLPEFKDMLNKKLSRQYGRKEVYSITEYNA